MNLRTVAVIVSAIFVLLATKTSAAARNPIAFNAADYNPEQAQFSLLAIGMGTKSVYMLGGHIAIRVRQGDFDFIFDWGIFDTKKEGFVVDYLKGDMNFEHKVRSFASTLRIYKKEDRTVTEYPLLLTQEQRARALRSLADWAKPERRVYRYDLVLENCSTAVRDVLSTAIGPNLKAFYDVPSPYTYRSIGMPYFYNFPAILPIADLGFGSPLDRRIKGWDEFFLPLVSFERYKTAPAFDDRGEQIPKIKLLGSPQVIHQGKDVKIGRVHWGIVYGVVLSLVAFGGIGLRYWARGKPERHRGARMGDVLLAAAMGFSGLFFGLFSMLLIALWTLTKHTLCYRNFNLAFLWPVDLVLVAMAWKILRTGTYGALSGAHSRVVHSFLLLHVAIAACASVGYALGVIPQDLRMALTMALPLWIAVYLDWRSHQRAPSQLRVGELPPME